MRFILNSIQELECVTLAENELRISTMLVFNQGPDEDWDYTDYEEIADAILKDLKYSISLSYPSTGTLEPKGDELSIVTETCMFGSTAIHGTCGNDNLHFTRVQVYL